MERGNTMKEEEEDTVLVSSDSDDDDHQQWVKKCKNKQFRHLWDKVQPLLFHYVLPEYKSSYFPYAKFKEFSEDLRKSLALVYVESTQAFIWKNLIRWLVSMKLCYEGFSDLKYDEKYNLILTDFMAQYMNYKCNLYCTIIDETEVCRRVDEILVTLGVVFSGNVPNILMTLLKIEVKDAYRLILDPIFRKYLSDKHLHDTHDLISYLRLVLCYRQWKKLAHFKEDKELINEIAVGKSEKTLKSQSRSMVVDLTEQEAVLPKIVPHVNEANKSFAVISGLIGFAMRNKTYGTRILLINKSLDLEETIVKYFQQYEKYINRSDNILCESTQALRIFDDFWEDSGCPVPLPKPILIQDFKRSSRQNKFLSDDLSITPTSKIRGKTEEHVHLESQNENNIDKQGTNAENQHLSTDCDIFKINNILNHSNLSKINSKSSSSSGSKQLSLSLKKKAQTRNSEKLSILSNKEDAVIELGSTDDDDDGVVVDDCISDKRTGSAVSYKKQTNQSPKPVDAQKSYIETLKQRAVNISNNSDSNRNISIGLKKRSNTIVLSSSSDEDDNVMSVVSVALEKQSNSENLARDGLNSKIKPIHERVSRRIAPHGERPIRKEKLHCITGEVSSTTSMDCASPPDADISGSINVSSLENAREVGTLSAVHTSPRRGSILASTDFSDISDDEVDPSSLSDRRHISRLNWSKFSKVVEEATSSTSEIPIRCTGETNPDNVIFSIHPHQLRRSTSSSPCPTRTSSPSESCLNISPSSTNRMGSTRSASRPRVTSVSRISMQELNSLTCDDDDVATCSKYVRRSHQREELQTNQASDRKSGSSVNFNLHVSQEESVTATCSRYASRLSSKPDLREETTDTVEQSKSTNQPLESLQRSNREVSAVEKETISLDAEKSEEKDNSENFDDDNEDLNEFLNEMSVLIGDTEEVNIFNDKSNNKESPEKVFSSLEGTEMEEYNLEVVKTNEKVLSSLQNKTISKKDLLEDISSQTVERVKPQEIPPEEVGQIVIRTESENLNLQTDMSKDSNESDKSTSLVLKTSKTTLPNFEEYKESEIGHSVQSSESLVRLIDKTICSNTIQEITSQQLEIEATKMSRVEKIEKASGTVSQLGKTEGDFTNGILEIMHINETSSSHSKIGNKVISDLSHAKQTLPFEDSFTEFEDEDASNDDDIESPAYEPITPEALTRDVVVQTSAILESKTDILTNKSHNPETLVYEAVEQTSGSIESKDVAEKRLVVAVSNKVSETVEADVSRDDHLNKNNSMKLTLEIQTDVESSEPKSHNEYNTFANETTISQNEVLKEVIDSSSLVEPTLLSTVIPSQVFEQVNSLDSDHFPECSNGDIVAEVNSVDNEHSSEGNNEVVARIPRETDHAYVSKVFEPKHLSETHCTDTKVVLSENQIENVSTEISESAQNFVMTNKSTARERHSKEYDEAPEIEVSAEEISDDQIFQDYITEGETSEDENYRESTAEVDKFPIKISQKKKLEIGDEVDNKKAAHNILKFEVNEKKDQPPVEDREKTQVLNTTFVKEYRCLIAPEIKEGKSSSGNETINKESKKSVNLEFECTENETTQIQKITSKLLPEQAPKDNKKTQVLTTHFVKQNQCLIEGDMISEKENKSVHATSVHDIVLKVKVNESTPENQSTIFKDQPGPKEDDNIQVLATHFGKQNQCLIDGDLGNRKDDKAVYAVNVDNDLLKVKINESTLSNQSTIFEDQPEQAPKDDDKTRVLVEGKKEADVHINLVRVDKSELGIKANDTVSQIQCVISKDLSLVRHQASSDDDKIQVIVTHVETQNQFLFNSEIRGKKPYIENEKFVKTDKKDVHSVSANESVNETTPQSQIKISNDKQDITGKEKPIHMQSDEENPNQYTKDESIVDEQKNVENVLPIIQEAANKNESCVLDVAETQCEQTVSTEGLKEVEKPNFDSLKNKDSCECLNTSIDENLREHAKVQTSVEALNDTQIEVEKVSHKVLKTACEDKMQLPAENSQKEKNKSIQLSDNLLTIEENINLSTPIVTEPGEKLKSKECQQIVTKSIEKPLMVNITDKHKFSINRKLKIRIASLSGELKKYFERSKIPSQEPENNSDITSEAKPIEESQLDCSKVVIKESSLESKPVKSEKKMSELQPIQETQSSVTVTDKDDQLDNEILKKSNEQKNSKTDSGIYINKEKIIAEQEFIEVDNLKNEDMNKTESSQFFDQPSTQIGDASKLCNDMSTINKQIVDQSDTSFIKKATGETTVTLQTTETVATEKTEKKKIEELTKDTTQVDTVFLGLHDEYSVNQSTESAKAEEVPLEGKTDTSKKTSKVNILNKKSSNKSKMIATPSTAEEKILTEVSNNESNAEKTTKEVLTTDEVSLSVNNVLIKSKDNVEKVCALTGQSIALQSLINMSSLESLEIRQNETKSSNLITCENSESLLKIQDTEFKTNDALNSINKAAKLSGPVEPFPQETVEEKLISDGVIAKEIIKSKSFLPESNSNDHDILKSTNMKSTISAMSQETVEKKEATSDCLIGNEIIKSVPSIQEAKSKAHKIKDDTGLLLVEVEQENNVSTVPISEVKTQNEQPTQRAIPKKTISKASAEYSVCPLSSKRHNQTETVNPFLKTQPWSNEAEAPILLNLRRTEIISAEDDSNLSTQVQVAAGDLDDPLTSFGSESAGSPYQEYTFESDSSPKESQSIEDQEVSKITSQESTTLTYHTYHDDCGTPVLDEKDAEDIDTPSTHGQIISLSILKEIPKLPEIPRNPIAFSNQYPSNTHLYTENQNQKSSPVIIRPQINIGPELLTTTPLTESLASVSSNTNESNSKKMCVSVSQFIEPSPKPKRTSESDSEYQRTPLKMRLKRRISQCADINEEFNLGSTELTKRVEMPKVQTLEASNEQITYTVDNVQPIPNYNVPLNLVIRDDKQVSGLNQKDILSPKKFKKVEISPEKEEEDQNLRYQESWFKKLGISKTNHKTLSQEMYNPDFHASNRNDNSKTSLTECNAASVIEQEVIKVSNQEKTNQEETIHSTIPQDESLMINKNEGRRKKARRVKKLAEPSIAMPEDTSPDCHRLVSTITKMETPPEPLKPYQTHVREFCTNLTELTMDAMMPLKQTPLIESAYNPEDIKAATILSNMLKKSNKVDDTLKMEPEKARKSRKQKKTNQNTSQCVRLTRSRSQRIENLPLVTIPVISPKPTSRKASKKRDYNSTESIWQHEKTKEILRSLNSGTNAALERNSFPVTGLSTANAPSDNVSDSDDAGKLIIDLEDRNSRITKGKGRGKTQKNNVRVGKRGKEALEKKVNELLRKANKKAEMEEDITPPTVKYNEGMLLSPANVFKLTPEVDVFFADANVPISSDNDMDPMLQRKSTDEEVAAFYPIIQLTEHFSITPKTTRRGRKSSSKTGRRIIDTNNKEATEVLTAESIAPKPSTKLKSNKKTKKTEQTNNEVEEQSKFTTTKALNSNVQQNNTILNQELKPKPIQKINQRLSFSIDSILGNETESSHSLEKESPSKSENLNVNKSNQSTEITMSKEMWLTSFSLRKNSKSLDEVVKELTEARPKVSSSSSNPSIKKAASSTSISHQSEPVETLQIRKKKNQRKSLIKIKMKQPSTKKPENAENTLVSPIETGIISETSKEKPILNSNTDKKSGVLDTNQSLGILIVKEKTLEVQEDLKSPQQPSTIDPNKVESDKSIENVQNQVPKIVSQTSMKSKDEEESVTLKGTKSIMKNITELKVTLQLSALGNKTFVEKASEVSQIVSSAGVEKNSEENPKQLQAPQMKLKKFAKQKRFAKLKGVDTLNREKARKDTKKRTKKLPTKNEFKCTTETPTSDPNLKSEDKSECTGSNKNWEHINIKEEILDDAEMRTATEIEPVQVVSENTNDFQSLKPITTPGDDTNESIAIIDPPKNALNNNTKNLQSSDCLESPEKVQIKLENTSEPDDDTKSVELKPIGNSAEEINSSCVASEMVKTSENHQHQKEKTLGITESPEVAHHRSKGTDFKEIAEQKQGIEDCKSSESSPKEPSMTTNESSQILESLEKSQTEVQQILKSTSSQEKESVELEPKGALEMNNLNESELHALEISKSDSTLLSAMSPEVSEEGLQHTNKSEISKVIHLKVSESKSKRKSKKKQKNEKFMKKSQSKLENTQNFKLTTKSVSSSEGESVVDALEVEKSLKPVETVQCEKDDQTKSKSDFSKPVKEAKTASKSTPERKKSKKAKKKIKNTSKSEALLETGSENKIEISKSAQVDRTQFEQKPDDKVTTKSTVISSNEILNAIAVPSPITDVSDFGASAKLKSEKVSASLDCTQICDVETTSKVAVLQQDKSSRNDLKHTESLQMNLQSSNVVKHIEEERQVEEETKPIDGVLDNRKAFHSSEMLGTTDSRSHFESVISEGAIKSIDPKQKSHIDDVVKTVQIDGRSRHQPDQTSESELIIESEHSDRIKPTDDASKHAEDSFRDQHSLKKNATPTDTETTDNQSNETVNESEEIYHPQTKTEPTPTAILPESESEPEQIIKNFDLTDNENVKRAPAIDEQQSEKRFVLEKPIETKCVEISQDTKLTEISKEILKVPESNQLPKPGIAEPINIAVPGTCKPSDLHQNTLAKVDPELSEKSADKQPKVTLPSEVNVNTESKVDSHEIVTEVEVINDKPSEHKKKTVEHAEICKETPKPTEKERKISKKPSKKSKSRRRKSAKKPKRTIKSQKIKISSIEQIFTDQVTEASTLPTEKAQVVDSKPKIKCTPLLVNDVESNANDAPHHSSIEEINGGILEPIDATSETVDTGTDPVDNSINKSLIEDGKVEELKIDSTTVEPDEVTSEDSDLLEKTEVTPHESETQVVNQSPESEKIDESSDKMKTQELTSVEMIEKTDKIITPPEKSTLYEIVGPETQISIFSPEEPYAVEEDLSSKSPHKALESVEVTKQATNRTAQKIVDSVSKDKNLEVNVLKETVTTPQSPTKTVQSQNLTCVSKPSDRNLVEKLDTSIITRKKVVVLVKKLNLHTIQEKSHPNSITPVTSTEVTKAKELKWTEFWKACDKTSKSQGKRKRLSLDCSNINASSLTGTLLNRSQSMEAGLVIKPEIPLVKKRRIEVTLKSLETLEEKDENQYSEKSKAIETSLVPNMPVSTSSNDFVVIISEDKSSSSSEDPRNHTGPQEAIPSVVSIINPPMSAREPEIKPTDCISPTSTSPSITPISSTCFSSSAPSLSNTTEVSPIPLISEALPVKSSLSTSSLSPTTTTSPTDSVSSRTSMCTVVTSFIAPISPITSSPSTSSLLISPATSTVSSIPLLTTNCSELTSIQNESEMKDDVQVRVKTDIQIEQKNEIQKVEEQLEMSIENILGNQLSKKDKNQLSTGMSKIIVTNRFDSVPDDIFAGSADTCDNIESKFYPTLLKPEDLLLNNTYVKDSKKTGSSDSQKKNIEFVCTTNTECSKETSVQPTNSEEENENESENPEDLVDTSTSEGNSASEIELTNIADIHTIGNSPIFEKNCIVQSECLSNVVEKLLIEPNPFQRSDCMISGNDRHKYETSDLTFLFGPPLLVLEPEIDTMPTVSPFDIQRKFPKHNTLPDVELDIENELFSYTVANFDPKQSQVNERGSTNGKQLSNTLATSDVKTQSTINYCAPAVEVSTDVGFESYDELLANNNPFFSASDLEKSKQNVTEQEMQAPPSPIVVNGLKSTESELNILTPKAQESSLNEEVIISNLKDKCPEENRLSNLITATTTSEKGSVGSDTSKKRNKDFAKDIPENKEIVDRPKYKKEKLIITLPPKEEAISSPVKLKSHPTPFWKRKSIKSASPKRDSVELKVPLPNADVEKSPNSIEVKKSILSAEANMENISKSSDDKLDISEPVKESPALITEVITIPMEVTALKVSTDTVDDVRSTDTLAKLPELDEVEPKEHKQQNKLPSEGSNNENLLIQSETNPNKLEMIELSQDRSSLPQPAIESVVQMETQDSDVSSCESPNKKQRIEEVINSLGEDKSPVEPINIKPAVQTDSNIEIVSTYGEHPTKISKIDFEFDNEHISDEPRTKKPRIDAPVKLECSLLYDETASQKPKAEAVARLSTDDLFDRLKRESPVNVLMRNQKTALQNASFGGDDNSSSDSDLSPLTSNSLPITSVDESESLSIVPSSSPSAPSSSPISTPSMPIVLTPSVLENSPKPKQIPSPVEPDTDKPKIVIEKHSALPKPVSAKPLSSKVVSSKKVTPAIPTVVNPPSSATIQTDTIGKSIKIAKKRTRCDKDVNKSKETSLLPPNPHPKSCLTPPVNNPTKPLTAKTSPAQSPLSSSSSKAESKLSTCRVTFSPLVTKIPEITPVLGRRMSTSSNSSSEQSLQPTKPVKSILISPSKCFSSKSDTVHFSQTPKVVHSMPPPIKPSPLLKADTDSPSSSQKLASPSQSPKDAKLSTTSTPTTVSYKNAPPIKPPTHSKRPSSTQNASSTTTKHSAGYTIMVASLTQEIESISESIKQFPKIAETYLQHKKRKDLVETLEQKRKQLEDLEKQHRYEIRQSQILFPNPRPHSEHKPFENHYRSVVHSSQREPKDRQKESRQNYVNKFGQLRNRSFAIPDRIDFKGVKEPKTLPSWEPKPASTEEIIADLKLKTSRRY